MRTFSERIFSRQRNDKRGRLSIPLYAEKKKKLLHAFKNKLLTQTTFNKQFHNTIHLLFNPKKKKLKTLS